MLIYITRKEDIENHRIRNPRKYPEKKRQDRKPIKPLLWATTNDLPAWLCFSLSFSFVFLLSHQKEEEEEEEEEEKETKDPFKSKNTKKMGVPFTSVVSKNLFKAIKSMKKKKKKKWKLKIHSKERKNTKKIRASFTSVVSKTYSKKSISLRRDCRTVTQDLMGLPSLSLSLVPLYVQLKHGSMRQRYT